MKAAAALCCVGLALAAFATQGTPIRATDDLGRTVQLAQAPQRIVTLAPFLTELVFSAGAGDRLVGVSAFSDFPREARALPVVANAGGPSLEAIAALRPDLVLAWRDSVRPEDLERFAALGIPTFAVQARHVEDVPRLLLAVGELTGRDVSRSAAGFRARIQALRAQYARRPRLVVFLEIWHQPLSTLAGTHWINEGLEVCGAENVFRDLSGVAPVVSWEELYRRDPPVIVGAGSVGNDADFLARWRTRPALSAVKARRLLFVDADLLQRPTLRLAEGITRLCEGLEGMR